ncbi:LacI family DNA-binding transcriptional regulator [Arthrobacter sp. M4]|uniref:LacI family DNA-binding transcriptional regulator n=1 Tax=Arthrobacter sp. M4 TaxID=218160 RepID=UPI0021F081E7|nr:LacI family DNA-binding transcriptional regulator [Arthrobacter sp. M4]
MADVAARAGVSRSLVSTVFREVPGASPVTRARVLQAAADLGYQLDNRARMLRRSRTRLLGVVFQVQDAFHSDLVEAMYPVAAAAEYDLVLSATTETRPEVDAIDGLLRDRCEALLLVAPQQPESWLADVAERVPTIAISRRIAHAAIDVVMTADEEVVDTALKYLTSLGHRNIAHLDGAKIHGASDRRRSYRKLMKRQNLGEFIRVLEGGNTEVQGIRAAEALAREQDSLPSAVICYNDRVAVGFMFGLRAAGIRVPEDISVVGYDDVHMAALPFISLTTVGQDAAATARSAIAHAVRRLDKDATPGEMTLVPPYLVERSTTLPVRQAPAPLSR